MVTGNKFHSVNKQATIVLTTKHGHEETITLNVAPVGRHNLILGLPWCQYHGVQFDWNYCKINQWSPDCEGRCFPSNISFLQVHTPCLDAVTPQQATPGAIGYDLHATTKVTIPPATRECVPTGVAVELPENTYGRITPRSGLMVKKQIDIGAGVIDPDYQKSHNSSWRMPRHQRSSMLPISLRHNEEKMALGQLICQKNLLRSSKSSWVTLTHQNYDQKWNDSHLFGNDWTQSTTSTITYSTPINSCQRYPSHALVTTSKSTYRRGQNSRHLDAPITSVRKSVRS